MNEPYFYLNLWSDREIYYPEEMPALDDGRWTLGKWKGAYLRLSEIMDADTGAMSYERTTRFFSSTIETGIKILAF